MAQWNSPAQMSHVNNEIRKASVSSEMEDTEGTRLADALFINLRSEIGYYHRHGGGVSISVIKPIIYVEKLYRDRGGGFRTTNKKKRDGRMFYRITTSFQLQAAIIDFEDESQKFNKFFDSISLRYLHEEGEEFKVKPGWERNQAPSVKETNSNTKEGTAGITATGNAVTPSLQYHVQQSESIEIDWGPLKHWRRGVTDETYPPLEEDEILPGLDILTPSSRRCRRRRLFFFVDRLLHPEIDHPRHRQRLTELEDCPRLGDRYTSCVHWLWTTELRSGQRDWAANMHESTSFPVSVTRIISQKHYRYLERHHHSALYRLLHFDFEVEVRLRQLGHRLHIFDSSSKPPGERFKKDYGDPMPSEHFAFCVCCAPRQAEPWPEEETINVSDATKVLLDKTISTGQPATRLPSQADLRNMMKQYQKKTEERLNELSSKDDQPKPISYPYCPPFLSPPIISIGYPCANVCEHCRHDHCEHSPPNFYNGHGTRMCEKIKDEGEFKHAYAKGFQDGCRMTSEYRKRTDRGRQPGRSRSRSCTASPRCVSKDRTYKLSVGGHDDASYRPNRNRDRLDENIHIRTTRYADS